MNLLDIILIVLVIASIYRGARVGFVRQLFSLVGILAGLYLSLTLLPIIAPNITSVISKTIIAMILFSLFVLLLGGVLELLAIRLLHHPTHQHKPAPWETALGGIFGFILSIAAIWLVTFAFSAGPFRWFSDQIKDSAVVSVIDERLPKPPAQIAHVQKFLSQAHLPQVFVGAEPAPTPIAAPTVNQAELDRIIAINSPSVVKIAGFGCGGILEGSGFVAANNMVVTNAHVVAGVPNPTVRDGRGTHQATVVYYNPNLDIALLRASKLAGAPLHLATSEMPRGTSGVFIGYPGGGQQTAGTATILERIIAIGRNIYGQGAVRRGVYTLSADIQAGDSGGPFITTDGNVSGVIFARSSANNNTGYAITSSQVVPIVQSNQTNYNAVGTGSCAE